MAKTYDDDEEQFGGFGREAVEEAAKRPTYASTQGQVGERERMEAAVAGPLKKPTPVKKSAPVKKEAPKAEAPKTEAPKPAAAPKKSTVDTMRDTTAKKYDKKRLEEAKKTATPEPKKDITPRGRMKAAGRSRSAESKPTINVPKGGTAVERMKKMREARFGKKSGGTVKMKSGGMVKSSASKRADGCAQRGKTRGKVL